MEKTMFDGTGCGVCGRLRINKNTAKCGSSGANTGVFAGEFAYAFVYKGGKTKGRAAG